MIKELRIYYFTHRKATPVRGAKWKNVSFRSRKEVRTQRWLIICEACRERTSWRRPAMLLNRFLTCTPSLWCCIFFNTEQTSMNRVAGIVAPYWMRIFPMLCLLCNIALNESQLRAYRCRQMRHKNWNSRTKSSTYVLEHNAIPNLTCKVVILSSYSHQSPRRWIRPTWEGVHLECPIGTERPLLKS